MLKLTIHFVWPIENAYKNFGAAWLPSQSVHLSYILRLLLPLLSLYLSVAHTAASTSLACHPSCRACSVHPSVSFFSASCLCDIDLGWSLLDRGKLLRAFER